MSIFEKLSNWLTLLLILLVAFDIFIWKEVVGGGPAKNPELYFFDVGQGDSEFIVLPPGVKALIDGGPDKRVLDNLSSVLSPFNRYIDLVFLSHSQLDHFGGLIEVLKRYQVGVFVFNGRRGETGAFEDLERELDKNNTPVIVLMEGDKIRYRDSRFDIISPNEALLRSDELNDTSLVVMLSSAGVGALFTGDLTSNVEQKLIKKYPLKGDILKVPHHGSKYSSSKNFLGVVSPRLSVIEVGKNSYGHPTEETLKRLGSVGSQILRTDKDGLIKLVIANQQINLFKKKL